MAQGLPWLTSLNLGKNIGNFDMWCGRQGEEEVQRRVAPGASGGLRREVQGAR